MAIYISQPIIIIDLQYLCVYTYTFVGAKYNEIRFEQLIQKKKVKIQDEHQFFPKIII